jgi:hypothetical protein
MHGGHLFAVYINIYETDFNTEYRKCTGDVTEEVEATGIQKLQRLCSIRHSVRKK